MSNEVTISLKEYNELKEDSRILSLLYASGVDNWEWYSEALSENEEDEDDE